MKFYDRMFADPMVRDIREFGAYMESLPAGERDHLWQRAYRAEGGHQEGVSYEMLRVAEAATKLDSAVVVDASNVASYIEEHGFDHGVIPSWIPPFPVMWWETSKTSYMATRRSDGFRPSAIGALATTRRYRQRVGSGPDDYEWHYDVDWTVFFLEPPKSLVYTLRDDLALPMTLGSDGVPMVDFDTHYRDREKKWSLLAPFLMAIGFTHCKNVDLVDGSMPDPALRKKQERRLGRPLTRFKELIIDPNMTQRRTGGAPTQATATGKKALHIARGHFAHYSEDKPLFGKYTGTFWRPAHVRGTSEAGTVYKDYKVKAGGVA